MNWFDVDKDGLAAILERRGKTFAVAELISNAWDSDATSVAVEITPIPNSPFASISILDNGEGFDDLGNAFTLFARSRRGNDAEKRGRFNLGEKLVLACCRRAEILSTSGSVIFDERGRRKSSKTISSLGHAAGTLFRAELRMTRDELAQVDADVVRFIPPVKTTYNGQAINRTDSLASIPVRLPTEIADADGALRRTTRPTFIEIYPAANGGEILELGIPVCSAAIPYRVNVMQKVPLNMERDNVTPAFAQTLAVAVMNAMAAELPAEQAAASWATDAISDPRADAAAVQKVIAARFGDAAVIATPGDPVANAAAAAAGFTVVHGGSLPAGAWENVRRHSVLEPAAKVFASSPVVATARLATGVCPMCGK